VPFFGLCLGFQCAVIEFARNVLGYADANTVEYNAETAVPLVQLISELRAQSNGPLGGTMRRGARPCKIARDSIAFEAYGEELIYERFRHRYEFSNYYKDEFINNGMVFSGLSADERSVVAAELPKETHPWFVVTQYHAEFKSRPNRAHPLFLGFIGKCVENR
jgi:CTP synthase